MTETSNKPPAARVYLRCPVCGSTELATTVTLRGSSNGTARLYTGPNGEPRSEFVQDGWSDLHWDSSSTIGVECRSCLWSYEGVDHLEQLAFTIREGH
jgi:hypothetical protein